VIATDHEAGDPAVDEALAGFAASADVLIHDGQYTDREYAARKGWGHSTPDGAVDAARAAGVRRLVLTSHDPDHADRDVDDVVTTARIRFPLTAGAHEGMTIEL
jgi:ribonuclease BN (tRNA processing enzyme)